MSDERNRPIRIFLNRSRYTKIPKDASQDEWRVFHRQWAPFETTARGMAIELYRGYSVAHLHEGRKTKDHWREAWYIALDFESGDKRSSLDYLAQQDLINTFASFGYTTPSHTEDDPHTRIVWIFDEPITDLETYEDLYRALLAEFPWADHSTKDATRFFYGSRDCQVWTNWSILPRPSWEYLVKRWQAAQPKPEPVRTIRVPLSGNFANYVTAAVENECAAIERAADGDRHRTRFAAAAALGRLVAAPWANLNKSDAFDKLVQAAMKNTETPRADIERVISDGITEGMSEPRPMPVLEIELKNVL